MTMDLVRTKDGERLNWTNHHWSGLLELAQRYGWEPIGTTPSEFMRESWGEDMCNEWSGRYDTNEYQIITDEDANNLASALERALPDIPDEDAVESKAERISAQGKVGTEILEGFRSEVWEKLNCFEKFAGCQEQIQDFIVFLRVGGCSIH